MSSILRPWVEQLSRRKQAVLLAAIRGCDGAPKGDPSKAMLWALRWDVLFPDDPNADPFNTKTFMGYKLDLHQKQIEFLSSLDQYPFHFVMHFFHACEIIGYEHPDSKLSLYYQGLYNRFCIDHLHTNPETHEQMNHRLKDQIQPVSSQTV